MTTYPQIRNTSQRSHFAQWTCDMCYTDVEELGMLAPGIALVVWHGAYALIGGQGHSDDELVIFNEPPRVDPCGWDEDAAFIGLDEPASAALSAAADAWEVEARAAMAGLRKGRLRDDWRLVETLREAGYDADKDGDVELWMYHKCGELIAAVQEREKQEERERIAWT